MDFLNQKPSSHKFGLTISLFMEHGGTKIRQVLVHLPKGFAVSLSMDFEKLEFGVLYAMISEALFRSYGLSLKVGFFSLILGWSKANLQYIKYIQEQLVAQQAPQNDGNPPSE